MQVRLLVNKPLLLEA